MPYIPSSARRGLLNSGAVPKDPGELNYVLTRTIIRYVKAHGLQYRTINDISGAFTEAMAEFRRRIVGAYEDGKIATNGDVYDELLP